MTDERSLSYELGTYDGRRYFLGGRAEPNKRQSEEFSIPVYYRDPKTESNVEVARVDTAHGYTHFDQLYRRDRNKKPVEWSYWKAVENSRRTGVPTPNVTTKYTNEPVTNGSHIARGKREDTETGGLPHPLSQSGSTSASLPPHGTVGPTGPSADRSTHTIVS